MNVPSGGALACRVQRVQIRTAPFRGSPVGLAPLKLGNVFSGRYTLERKLGRGGTATVYLAHDLEGSRLVALKVFHADVVAPAMDRERFLRKLRHTARVQHPHIVALLDTGELDGCLYCTMPYAAGESLRARLTRAGPLVLGEALRITRQVAAGLAYAHERGMVHGNIKPENILLEGQDTGAPAVVADFGVAQAVASAAAVRLSATGAAIGTPAYMSPEQASGQDWDGRTDIYSLGCVLYEMLGGEPPYTGPTGEAIIAKRLHEPIPHLRALRPEVPEFVAQVMTKALAKAPADRFATAEEFAAALAPARTVPIARHRPGRLVHRLAVGAVATAAAAVAIGTALLRPRSTAAPAEVPSDVRRVVVAVFQNQTADTALDPLGHIVADYLARGLAETRLVEVVDARADQPGDSAARHGRVAGALALARRLGAGSVIWGSYSRRGDSLEFHAQLSDATTGNPITAVLPAIGSAVQQTQGVEALRQHVMSALAARLDPRLARFADVGASHPASYQAYREFLAGDTMTLDVPPDWGLAHFRRAYALDTNFTLPLVQIAGFGAFWGPCERVDSIADLLRPRLDRLPPYDRAMLDQSVARCHGQRERAMAILREAMNAAPRSDLLALFFAWHARHNGFLREAIAVTEKLDPARHERDNLYWGNLIIPLHLLSEHRRELEAAQQARRFFPGDVQMLLFEARALVGLGRLAEVNARVAEMLRVPQEVPQDMGPLYSLDEVGRDLLAHGHRPEAKVVFERAIRHYQMLPRAVRAERRVDLAVLLFDLGRWTEALPILRQQAAKHPNDIGIRYTLGAVYARLGDRRAVERVDRWLAARKGAYLNGEPTSARAGLAAILGERERTMVLLRQAADEGAFLDGGHGLGPHSDPDFDSLRHYPPFQELMKAKD